MLLLCLVNNSEGVVVQGIYILYIVKWDTFSLISNVIDMPLVCMYASLLYRNQINP